MAGTGLYQLSRKIRFVPKLSHQVSSCSCCVGWDDMVYLSISFAGKITCLVRRKLLHNWKHNDNNRPEYLAICSSFPGGWDCKGLFQSRTWIFCFMFSRSKVMSRLMWKFSAKNDPWSHAFVHLWEKNPCKYMFICFVFVQLILFGISKSFAKLVDHNPGFIDVGILHSVEMLFLLWS